MASGSDLRQRHQAKRDPTGPIERSPTPEKDKEKSKDDQVVWGKTPGGEVFRVPTTYDVLTALFHPAYPKSHLDFVNLFLLGSQLVLFALMSRRTAQIFFLFYFAFWRAAYDAGLGWVLTKQSKKKWIVKEVNRRGWLDEKRRPAVRSWIRQQLQGKMGKDYNFDDLPLEYNTWLLFRQLVDIILLNDFVSYCMFAFACFRIPTGLSIGVHVLRWLGGIALIGFNVWVKTEAHNVVKDYGWYWGDVFFQRGNLVFDGVFELAPHPMYSVGYAGFYGLSLISGSYAVLFVSLAGHAAQFAFLVLFENPHIERAYGQRKPLARRTPVNTPAHTRNTSTVTDSGIHSETDATLAESTTETELDTETDAETETETEIVDGPSEVVPSHKKRSHSNGNGRPFGSMASSKPTSLHDLMNRYFRRDTIILKNVDLLRTPDAMLVVTLFYAFAFAVLPLDRFPYAVHFTHALAWCIFHTYGLGFLLRAQSRNKFIVRHFLNNYHYTSGTGKRGAIIEAFANWKSMYNWSLCMSYVSFFGLVWKTYSFPSHWTVGTELLRHTFGAVLIGLHIWVSLESFEALGVFGWYFGDFFMEEFPPQLEYAGIYRYLNNPDVIGGTAWFGLSLISGSRLALFLAAFRFISLWWFLSVVENPHMQKLYGDSLRKDAGFIKVMKSVARQNVRLLESRASRHAPKIRKVAKEVKGTFDKVYEETAEAVEEFLAKSKPKISEVVQDTKVLLQQSREKLVITRVDNNISSYDPSKYKLRIVPSANGTMSFHAGEPIKVEWEAPLNHSRRDWIGLYKVGANKSTLVTKTSSLGMWVPVHDEDWEGDIFLGKDNDGSADGQAMEKGCVVFKGNTLPWMEGTYEIRYHHNGKYNVMSLDGPLEIYVDKPSEPLTFESVHACLSHFVPLCLDSDPSLIPISCMGSLPSTSTPPSSTSEGDGGGTSSTEGDREGSGRGGGGSGEGADGGHGGGQPTHSDEQRDPDDFNFWSERQAKRICTVISQAFGVEYPPEVIVADANLTALTNRILTSKEVSGS